MRIRPQILLIGTGLTIVAGLATYLGHLEVATAAVGGLIGVAVKLAEAD